VRVPAGVNAGIELAARSQLLSPAEYVRSVITRAVRADGFHIDDAGRVRRILLQGEFSDEEGHA
jgi:hypothetical protein